MISTRSVKTVEKAAKSGSIEDVSEGFFEKLITLDELLALLKHQYARRSVYKWVEQQGMPYKRIRGRLWFPRAEVIQWLERSSA